MSDESKKPRKIKKDVRLKSLNPRYIPKVRKELLDMDYLSKLSTEEYRWLAQFMDEYVGANVRKTKGGKIKAGHIHNTKELAKDCYDRNNKRNNDVFAIAKANNLLNTMETVIRYENENQNNNSYGNSGWKINNPNLIEEAIIHAIDEKNLEKLK